MFHWQAQTSPKRKRGYWIFPFVALSLCLPISAARADEVESLERFLNRLGLADLRLHQMERALAQETATDKRVDRARRLADAYAEQLLSAADEPERFAALERRVQKLLTDVPAARTPAAEVVLLEADYQRAEALLIRWMEDPSDKTPLLEAADILSRIAPQLVAQQRELAAGAEELSAQIDDAPTDQQRAASEQQAQKQMAIAARAGYFAGWSHYYLGIARQNPPAAKENFAAAKQRFLTVLGLTGEGDYALADAEGLGLESIWRARAAIGLGLAELGLNRPAAAAVIFGWLEQASVSPMIRDQAAYWQVQGMLNVGLIAESVRLIAAEVEGFTSTPSAGKSSLCIAAIRAAAPLDTNRAERQQLIEQAIRGLARMRQFETLDRLIEKHKLDEAGQAAGFHLEWLRGRRQYLAAEKSDAPDAFRAAAQTLSAALAHPQAKIDLNEAGQARYYLGWCHYRLDELEPASRLFQEAATALRASVPDLAAQAAWMRTTCLVQLAAKDKRQAAAAIAALQTFKQEFPASSEAQRVDLLVTRLRQSSGAPAESIRELAAIRPGDPNYVPAQYELCQLHYQLWTKAKSEPAKAAPLASEVVKAADRFLASADSQADQERRLKAALLAIDVLQASKEPDNSRVAPLMRRAAQAAEQIDPANLAAVEFQYRRLQFAQRTSDEATAADAARSIAEHGRGSPYELPALVLVGRAADEAVKTASDVDRPAAVDKAAVVYARLVELLGDSTDVLKSNSNALAAASKLAQYDEELGRWPEAAERLNRLVDAAASDRRLLRRAGLANVRAGRHAEALEHWRKLLAGLPSGSDDWMEAKYYQVVCLLQTDRAAAEKVWNQFRLLFPEVKSENWGEKFQELERKFQ